MRRLLHISATHWSMECGGLSNVTMTMYEDLGCDILALSETHKWRSDTDAIFSEQAEDGDPYSVLRFLPVSSALSASFFCAFCCFRNHHRSGNATKMSKDRKLWSTNRPSLRCNFYEWELQ